VNLPVEDPGATVIVVGMPMAFEGVASFTMKGPVLSDGAAFRVTNPTELLPPATVDGLSDNPMTANGLTVSVVDYTTLPHAAVIVTV